MPGVRSTKPTNQPDPAPSPPSATYGNNPFAGPDFGTATYVDALRAKAANEPK